MQGDRGAHAILLLSGPLDFSVKRHQDQRARAHTCNDTTFGQSPDKTSLAAPERNQIFEDVDWNGKV